MQSWTMLRRLAGAWLRDRRQFREKRLPRTCPICGYHGVFISVGHPPRWDARCLGCGSRERHRLTHLWITEGGGDRLAGGETAGAIVQALGVTGLRIGRQIDLGVPWTASLPGSLDEPVLALALKSGNFGAPDFFLRAFSVLSEGAMR